MKRALKIIVIAIGVAFIAIQFIPVDMTNPPIDPAQTIEATMNLPAEVQQIMARSCNDCHSSKTVYPWYARIAPVSWWMNDHINDGRREVNFSEWGTYSDKKKSKKLEEICEQVRGREMPLPSYLWIHRDAILTESDIETLCSWTESERKKMATAEAK